MSLPLSLLVIVRDEAMNLARCLASVQGLVDHLLVVDTGSQDASPQIARQYGAQVLFYPWQDSFAQARNYAQAHCPTPWLLWLDADEYLTEPARQRLAWLRGQLSEGLRAYVLWQRSRTPTGQVVRLPQVRLFRGHPEACWDYRVHEQILPSLERLGYQVCDAQMEVEHTGYSSAALCWGKRRRNLVLLLRELEERPGDRWVLWNLGWVYWGMGEVREARRCWVEAGFGGGPVRAGVGSEGAWCDVGFGGWEGWCGGGGGGGR
jgi:glycosyltransferase involved in cell wall biosynthesis